MCLPRLPQLLRQLASGAIPRPRGHGLHVSQTDAVILTRTHTHTHTEAQKHSVAFSYHCLAATQMLLANLRLYLL